MSARLIAWGCLLCAAPGSTAVGQVVQLPTFRYFSVQTSVLAPDRGGAYLGGVSRSASGSSTYGVPGGSGLPGVGRLFGNRALDHSASGSGASVHATIIDHNELDRAVLAEAASRRSPTTLLDRRAADVAQRMGTSARAPATSQQPLLSVAEMRRHNEVRRANAAAEAARLLAQGQEAEARGQTAAARIFYQMAQKRATGELQTQIAARRKSLEPRGS